MKGTSLVTAISTPRKQREDSRRPRPSAASSPDLPAEPWIQTFSGGAWSLSHPRAADVRWRDVAVALGRICRFGGHTLAFYSVAQHCRECARLIGQAIAGERGLALLQAALPSRERAVAFAVERARRCDEEARRLTLHALLHDAHEAYIGDIPTPVAAAIALEAGDPGAVDRLKERADGALFRAAGLTPTCMLATRAAVKAVDLVMLATEKRDLMAEGVPWSFPLPAPAPFRVVPEAEAMAADRFLAALDALLPGAAG
jgi:hypothetical protein